MGVEGEARGLACRFGEFCALVAACVRSLPALPGSTAVLSSEGAPSLTCLGCSENHPRPQKVVLLLIHALEGLHPWGA